MKYQKGGINQKIEKVPNNKMLYESQGKVITLFNYYSKIASTTKF